MTFFARCGPFPCQLSTRSRDTALAPSAVRASIVSGPGLSMLKARRRTFRVPAGPPGVTAAVRAVTSVPLTRTVSDGAPAPVASTRRSKRWPAASTPPSAGMIRMRVSADAALAPQQSASAQASTRLKVFRTCCR